MFLYIRRPAVPATISQVKNSASKQLLACILLIKKSVSDTAEVKSS
jgi:hypothetical protein